MNGANFDQDGLIFHILSNQLNTNLIALDNFVIDSKVFRGKPIQLPHVSIPILSKFNDGTFLI